MSSGTAIDKHGTERPRAAASAALLTLLAALALGGCGGGGGGGIPGPGPSPSPGPLAERADTLLLSGARARWSLSTAGAGGETIEDSLVEGVTCAGARCVAADGTVTTARELLDPSAPGDTAETTVGMRGGFDTAETGGAFEVFSETLPGLALTVTPEVTSYGFWGVHGFASLSLGTGTLSAQIDGTAYAGDFSLAQAWTAGDATGTNPAGTGSATWTGIAEASPTGAFRRLMGTATVTIADLSRPRVDVGIDLDVGGATTPLRWADIPLADGGFRSGTAGTDYLEGNFHGPRHEEA